MAPRGLVDLKTACRKLDTHEMSKQGIQAWYELSKMMPPSTAVVVQKRIRDQLAKEQGISVENQDVMPMLEPLIDELMKETPEEVTEGYKTAKSVIGKPIMIEYIGDLATHLKGISGVM
jgi:hypothetical protein